MVEGVLKKMITEYESPIQYYLSLSDDIINVNSLIDKKVSLTFKGYECLSCKKQTTLYRQGFCKNCFFSIPQAAEWVLKPELSKAHLEQEDRDLNFEKQMQLQPHIVYLAYTSHIKVGVTRKSQIPTRWIDQGAHSAIPLLETPNRYLAGVAEVALKNVFYDKTHWTKMLQSENTDIDWSKEKQKAIEEISEELKQYVSSSLDIYKIIYPTLTIPSNVKSLNLEKESQYIQKLIGVKGQYLIFEEGIVFNIRGNEGTMIDLSFSN